MARKKRKTKRRESNRKSPHKHTVRTKHSRYHVTSYERGSGEKARRKVAVRKRRIPKPKSPKGDPFDVRVQYEDSSFEFVDVTARNFTGALDTGIEARQQLKTPVIIRMRRR